MSLEDTALSEIDRERQILQILNSLTYTRNLRGKKKVKLIETERIKVVVISWGIMEMEKCWSSISTFSYKINKL